MQGNPTGANAVLSDRDVAESTLRRWVIGAIVLTSLVVVLGAFTRLTDAGLGCPDWPGCYGFVGVPHTEERIAKAEALFPDAPVEVGKAWMEMVHRYFASSLGLVIIIIAGLAWRRRHLGTPIKLPLALVALVCLQGAFGAWTVTLKLWPQVVTLHLLGGFATLSLLWLLALRLGVGRAWRIGPAVKGLATAGLLLVVLQSALGGWVSSNYAALACGDFPTCDGSFWPEANYTEGFDIFQDVGPNYLGGQLHREARVAIHYSHRLLAILVTVVVGLLAWRMWRRGDALALAIAGSLALQIALGITNIVAQLPLLVATAHNAGAALLLLVLVAVNYRTRQPGLAAHRDR